MTEQPTTDKHNTEVPFSELEEFISGCWWSGATCHSLTERILEKFEVRTKYRAETCNADESLS